MRFSLPFLLAILQLFLATGAAASPVAHLSGGAALTLARGQDDVSAGVALGMGFGLTLHPRWQLGVSATMLPDAQRAGRSEWRVAPALRAFVLGDLERGGLWLELASGLALDVDRTRPFARGDAGYALAAGSLARVGLYAGVQHDLVNDVTLVTAGLRLDGWLQITDPDPPARVESAAIQRPITAPAVATRAASASPRAPGRPLSDEVVRTHLLGQRDDVTRASRSPAAAASRSPRVSTSRSSSPPRAACRRPRSWRRPVGRAPSAAA